MSEAGRQSSNRADAKALNKLAAKEEQDFNLDDFMSYAYSPKNFSFVTLFTSEGPLLKRCKACYKIKNEFKIVEESFVKSPEYKKSILFFGGIDFQNESDIYKVLNVTRAPVLIHFPPSGNPAPDDFMDIVKFGTDAESIAKWIESRAGIKIKILPPTFFHNSLKTVFFHSLPTAQRWAGLFTNRTTIAVTATVFCYDMVSGYVWNTMHDQGFMGNGAFWRSLISTDPSVRQYGVERFIVFLINCIIALGMHLVIRTANRRGKWKALICFVGMTMIIVSFSILLFFMRCKIARYPFSLLF